jgi:hypothetical protein
MKNSAAQTTASAQQVMHAATHSPRQRRWRRTTTSMKMNTNTTMTIKIGEWYQMMSWRGDVQISHQDMNSHNDMRIHTSSEIMLHYYDLYTNVGCIICCHVCMALWYGLRFTFIK